jgi:hypothetical protein
MALFEVATVPIGKQWHLRRAKLTKNNNKLYRKLEVLGCWEKMHLCNHPIHKKKIRQFQCKYIF